MICNADNFPWAKQLLSTGAASFLNDNENCGMLSLPLPKTYIHGKNVMPHNNIETGIETEEQDKEPGIETNGQDKVDSEEADSISKRQERKASKRQTPVLESEVRRSERVRQNNRGFKSADQHTKKCTCCYPPIMSTKVIRNLGVQFCSMKEEDLEDGKLLKGGGIREPVARKKAKKQ